MPALIAAADNESDTPASSEVVWFPINPEEAMRDAAGEILDWLDDNKIPHEWLGHGRWTDGKFRVAISFQKPEHVSWAILRWP